MSIIRSVVWGAIQGITEFLPVSSSGHLVVMPRLFKTDGPDMIMSIYLHVGTLLAVLLYFRKELKAVFSKEKEFLLFVFAATAPLLLFGLFLADRIKPFFESPRAAGWALIINGLILLTGAMRLTIAPSDFKRLSAKKALLIGAAQVAALFPGISRSGVTITAGLHSGLDRKDAFKFSFFIFIPACLLAFLYSLKEASFRVRFDIYMLAGFAASAVVGLVMLKALLWLLMKRRWYLFGVYCISLGAVALIFLI